MEGDVQTIIHRTLTVNGIRMHVAEKGEGPVVLFLHGFPELWYSWRHQMLGLAERGYRAVAPDLRGFGDTDAPSDLGAYAMARVVGDLVALVETLGQKQVFVVGHDWGALVAWSLCLFRPDKVRALVNLSVVYRPRNPSRKPLEILRSLYGDDYYICKFQGIIVNNGHVKRRGVDISVRRFERLTIASIRRVEVSRSRAGER